MLEALISEFEAIEDPRCDWKVEHCAGPTSREILGSDAATEPTTSPAPP